MSVYKYMMPIVLPLQPLIWDWAWNELHIMPMLSFFWRVSDPSLNKKKGLNVAF